jgi:hypothetical protein
MTSSVVDLLRAVRSGFPTIIRSDCSTTWCTRLSSYAPNNTCPCRNVSWFSQLDLTRAISREDLLDMEATKKEKEKMKEQLEETERQKVSHPFSVISPFHMLSSQAIDMQYNPSVILPKVERRSSADYNGKMTCLLYCTCSSLNRNSYSASCRTCPVLSCRRHPPRLLWNGRVQGHVGLGPGRRDHYLPISSRKASELKTTWRAI